MLSRGLLGWKHNYHVKKKELSLHCIYAILLNGEGLRIQPSG